MKTVRILCFILALACLLSLGACKKPSGGSQSPADEPQKPTEDVQPPQEPGEETQPPAHVCAWVVDTVVMEHSCTQDGLVIYSCACGKSRTERTLASGHEFGEWSTESEAKCDAFGEEAHTCTTCYTVEKRTTDKLTHTYTSTEEEADGVLYKSYACATCQDSFVIESERAATLETLASHRLSERPADFSFQIYCAEDEDYIREHLVIFDTYYEGTENEDEAHCAYTLVKGEDDVWRVLPEEPYKAGATYKAVRSGGISFLDCGFGDLTFSIFREESLVADVSDGILFLAALEKQSPGYYPYSLDYSERSGNYWLTLSKVDGLRVGDILCVGKAENAEDIKQLGNAVFGKIAMINDVAQEGVYQLVLTSPELGEVFDRLDIHSSHPEQLTDVQLTDIEQLSTQVTSALYNSKDFVDFMGAGYVTAIDFLAARGAGTDIGTFAEFLNSIQINEEETQMPELDYENGIITARIVVDGEVSIPVTVTSYGTTRNVGNIVISFTAYVYLDYAKLQVSISEVTDAAGKSHTNYKFGIAQSVTTGFAFNVAIDVDYSLEAYPYVVNKRSGCYHFASCIHVASMNEANAEYVSATQLMERINKGELLDHNECGTCRPISSMESDNYVLNRTSKKIHLVDCKHLQTVSESELLISGAAYGTLELAGYSACESCQPYSRYTNSFSEALMDKMENGDFGHNVEEIKQASDKAGSEEARKRLQIAELPLSFGPLRADVELYVFVNFTLKASLSYQFERTDVSEYGVELKGKRFVPYEGEKSTTTNEHSLQVVGETRLEVGAAFVAKAYIVGLEKWMYASFNVEVGAYALANGAVRLDWVSMNDGYFAAYFESGFILNIYFEGKIPFKDTFSHVFYEGDYPFIKLGFEKVAHKFTALPEQIELDNTYLSLDMPELFTVGYYDVVNQKTGTAVLHYLGIQGRYDVEYGFADGSNCFVENGVLYVIDPSQSFTDELTITVLGYDKWDAFKTGNTKFTLPTVSVPIVYKAQENVLSYDISDDHSHYYVIGIGTYSDSALLIPETYNDKPVSGIERHALANCLSITSVVIPDSIEYMGDHAFYYCENLTGIVIGDGLEVLAQGVFNVCTNVAYISIGENVKTIGSNAFEGCRLVKTVVIPDSVQTIEGAAFSDCDLLETVVIGKGVQTLGRHAFSADKKLKAIYVPKALKVMEDNVLYYCDALTDIYYEGSETDIASIVIDESNLEYIEKATVHYNYQY